MRLVYAYLENFRHLKKQHLQFDYSFDFFMNDRVLKIGKSANYQSVRNIREYLLKGKNVNELTVIVGENGAGKSTVLEAVKYYCDSFEEKAGQAIFIFLRDNKEFYTVQYNIERDIKLDEDCQNQFKIVGNPFNFTEKLQFITLNNFVNINDYQKKYNKNIINLTVGGLMRQDLQKEFDMQKKTKTYNTDVLLNHQTSETVRQLHFFAEYKKNFSELNLPIKIPLELNVEVIDFNLKMNSIFGENGKKGKIENVEKKQLIELINLFNQNRFKYMTITGKIVIHILLGIIDIFSIRTPHFLEKNHVEENENLFKLITEFINKTDLHEYENIEIVFRNLDELCDELKLLYDDETPYLEIISEFIKSILDNLPLFENGKNARILWDQSIVVNIDEKSNENMLGRVFSLLKVYKKSQFYVNCFKFDWRGLSTGEYNMLNTFAKLYSIQTNEEMWKKLKGSEQVLLLIDEADATLHPSWQAQYVSFLISFANVLFKGTPLQIILTTHSPILLSDFTRFNTINLSTQGNVLDFKEYKKTFGQNIYTLFTDVLYLQQPRGEFVKSIIERVEEDLKNIVENHNNDKGELINLDKLSDVVKEIGEPVIRDLYLSKIDSLRERDYSKIEELMSSYRNLNSEEKNKFIEFIISNEENK